MTVDSGPGGPPLTASPAQPVDPSPQASTQIPADLGRRTARGAGITLAGQGARILLQLLSVMVLARLLDPSDYGLLAVGLVVVGIGEVVRDFGLTSAAVRAPELTIQQRNGLFWINSGAGVLLTLLAVASAGPIADALGQPELAPIIRALALTFVLNGLAPSTAPASPATSGSERSRAPTCWPSCSRWARRSPRPCSAPATGRWWRSS